MVENEDVKGIDSKGEVSGKKETKGIKSPKGQSKETKRIADSQDNVKKSGGKDSEKDISSDEKLFAVVSHLSGLLMYVLPIIYILIPLVIWLVKSEENAYIRHHARQSTLFQIFVVIAYAISGFLCLFLIGFILLVVVAIFHIVCSILAALAASRGELYSYPVMGWVLEKLNIEA